MYKISLWLFTAALLVASCKSTQKETAEAQPDFLASNIDSTIQPGEDFFLYANNGWFKNNPIPASEQGNGLWQLIRDTINAQVKQICESSASIENAEKGSNKQKIGDMFFSGMDSITLNKNGITPIQPELNRIEAAKDLNDIANVTAMAHMYSSSPLYGLHVAQDDMNSEKYAIYLWQGGLSLPDRSYYLDNEDRFKKIRAEFSSHLTDMFSILGYDSIRAKNSAANLLKFETAIAKASRKREDTRDPYKNYNKMTVAELTAKYPNLYLQTFLAETGLKSADSVILGQPEVFAAVDKLVKTSALQDVKDYLKYHFVRGLASYMDDKTYMESFSFYSTTIRGIEEPKPRWKRVTDMTNNSLGELIGQVYVSEYLPKGTKEKLTEIGNAIKSVYEERIKQLDWMSDATKEKALVKLNSIVMKVGYPDKWKDLSTLNVDRSSYVRNVMNANKWEMEYMVNKYGKPVNRNEWEMTPQTYNAYYNPSNNEIVVPGSNIIVPGYERTLADDAILYSIIGGSTFGHEITHGFDDQGSQYDSKGNLNNWWTSEDSLKFFTKTKMVVDQFNQYIVIDSLTINGDMTQGENIADIGGVMMGYEAFKKTQQYREKQIIGGLNPDQRFFLGYALAWMINDRPEALAAQVKSDVHSPAKYRVIGPLVNMPEFFTTFNIKEGDKLYRPDSMRVKIW